MLSSAWMSGEDTHRRDLEGEIPDRLQDPDDVRIGALGGRETLGLGEQVRNRKIGVNLGS